MKFEWSENKAVANLSKHRVSFEEATTVFDDPLFVDFYDPDHFADEERYLIVGESNRRKLLIVSYTERATSIRIISAREVTPSERESYEEDCKSMKNEFERLGLDPDYFRRLININNIKAFFQELIRPIASLKHQRPGSIEFHRWKRNVEEQLGQPQIDSERYLQEFSNIDFDKNYESALNEAQVLFQSYRDNLINSKPATMKQQNSSVSPRTNDIFIVHGHDEEMKQAVARTLERLKLKPIILHEQLNQGATIIEKFEKNANVQFAIILLSPDDIGYLKTEGSEKAQPRARQNVILELGYFIGKLSRAKVFVLKRDNEKDELELPTDINGITYTSYDSGDSWKSKLFQELKATGYNVDANDLFT